MEEKQKAAWAGVEANIRKTLRYSRSPVSVLQDLPRHVVSPKLRCPQGISSSPGLPVGGGGRFCRTHCERRCFKKRMISLRGDWKEAREQGRQPRQRWGVAGGGLGLHRGGRRWSPQGSPTGQAVAPLAGLTQETAGGIGSARRSWAAWCQSPSAGGPRAAQVCQGLPAPGQSA